MAEAKAKAKKKPVAEPKQITDAEMKEELAAREEIKASTFMGEYRVLCDKFGVDRVTDAVTTASGRVIKLEQIIYWKK